MVLRFTHAAPAALMLLLSGCSMFGGGKQAPDEFTVVNKRPLVVPPDFQLRPPEPGKPSPQNIQPAREVVNALFPDRVETPPELSRGELALLSNVRAGEADIRSQVGDGTEVVDKGLLLPELLSAGPRSMASDGATIRRLGSEPHH